MPLGIQVKLSLSRLNDIFHQLFSFICKHEVEKWTSICVHYHVIMYGWLIEMSYIPTRNQIIQTINSTSNLSGLVEGDLRLVNCVLMGLIWDNDFK